jgi:hypothetical protein
VLYLLGRFVPGYDINDQYLGKPMDRPPKLSTQTCLFHHLPIYTRPVDFVSVYKEIDYNLEYDIDDLSGKERVESIKTAILHWKADRPFVKK